MSTKEAQTRASKNYYKKMVTDGYTHSSFWVLKMTDKEKMRIKRDKIREFIKKLDESDK